MSRRVLGSQSFILQPQQFVRLHQAHVVVLQRRAAHALGLNIRFEVREATVGFGQAILEDALEACLGVALATAAAVFVLEAPVAATEAVVEEQASQGEGGGDDGAATEGVPEEI
jgi:hypothetical protein